MCAKFLPVSWLAPCALAVALMAAAMSAIAEAPPRNNMPITITPEMIQQASKDLQPSKELSRRTRAEYLTHDTPASATFGHQQPSGGCARNSGSLCFDYRTGRTLYKPMRKLLPDIPGMTPHNLSIRRNRVVAEYTFK